MSAPGRPKGEYRSAQHEGTPVSPHGRHGPEGATSWPLGSYTAVRRTEVA
jgi:hypothetical protein